jgi:hypothetical protein
MSMFDGLLGDVAGLAEKMGLPAEQVQGLAETLSGKLSAGGDPLASLMAAAKEHGVPTEQVEALLAGAGGTEGLLGRMTGMLDRDGDGNPLNELGGLAKGLFG